MRLTRLRALLYVAPIFGILLIAFLHLHRKIAEISPAEARENMKAGMYDFVVDVRTDEEWNEGHLENTVSIPIGKFVSELPKRIPDKNARILFICKKGIRASAVAGMAQKLGYPYVHAMIGNYSELTK